MMNELLKIWKEAKTSTDYIIALWITTLAVAVGVGSVAILYTMITNPFSL